MKTYNEFAKEMRNKNKKVSQEDISKSWKAYKTDSLKTVTKTYTPLPVEVKAINKKLTEKLNELFELRAKKKDGKDVKIELNKVLTYLTENRIKKKEVMKKLGL